MNLEEQQVIDIFKELLDKYDKQGVRKVRDGHTRVSLFGKQLRFDLSKSFPLLTHRQLFVRGIFLELMWMLRGQTDNKILEDQKVHIWSPWNGIIDKDNPTEMGKIYGEIWRNFGEVASEYQDDFGEVIKKGFDQIEWLINEIKTNPSSSRLILSGWDPHISTQTPKEAVLPCCHLLFQFHVEDGKLSGQLYMRSHDVSIAGGYNIAAYALLIHMVAQQCSLDVGELVMTYGNIHLYGNQIDDVREMVKRETHPFPQIKINKAKDLYSYEWSDIEIINYSHSGKMENLKVAV